MLGLDFFGSTQPPTTSRPSSTSSTPAGGAGMSRPDLKQSILSLYAKPQPPQHQRAPSFGDMASPPPPSTSSPNMGGLTDAFSGLTIPSTTSPPPSKPAEKPSPFANLTSFASAKSPPAAPKVSSPTASAGGSVSLFDSLASPTGPPSKPQSRNDSFSSFGQDFGFPGFASSRPQQQSKPPQPSKPSKPSPPAPTATDDLFGLSSPLPSTTAAAAPPPPAAARSPQEEMKSAFNLNPSPPPPLPKAQPETPAVSTPAVNASMLSSSIDPWGGGNAWSAPDPEPAAPAAPSAASMMKVPATLTANDVGSGWGTAAKPAPTVAADEDFGGWESAAPVSSTAATATATTSPKPAGGFGGADDLFSNVWE